jgi:hypothetical protein
MAFYFGLFLHPRQTLKRRKISLPIKLLIVNVLLYNIGRIVYLFRVFATFYVANTIFTTFFRNFDAKYVAKWEPLKI